MSLLLEPSAESQHFEPPEDTTVTFTGIPDPTYLPYHMQQQLLQNVEPTPFARKYGISKEPFFSGTGKSGFTPVSPPGSAAQSVMSPQGIRKFNQHEVIQRQNLTWFTSWELRDSGCWVDGDVKLSDLSCPIHPIFARTNWLSGSAIPVGGGYVGTYEARNLVVWEVLQPALRLATLLLGHTANSRWFDALCYATRDLIPPDQCDDGCPPDSPYYDAFQILPRPWHVIHPTSEDATDHLSSFLWSLAGRIHLAIGVRGTEAEGFTESGKKEISVLPIGANGATRRLYTKKTASGKVVDEDGEYEDSGKYQYTLRGVSICMSFDHIAPLLHVKLTYTERLAQLTLFAKTLVHETMHAVGMFVAAGLGNHRHVNEPFYDDEPVSELGYSWENSVFGGVLAKLQSTPREPQLEPKPRLGIVLGTWPTPSYYGEGKYKKSSTCRFRHQDRHGIGSTAEVWPFRATYMENFFQTDFWELNYKLFGASTLVPPKILGKRFLRQDGWKDVMTVFGSDFEFFNSQPEPQIPDDPDEYAAWISSETQKLRADVLNTALRKQSQGTTQYQRDMLTARDWQEKRSLNPNLGRESVGPEQWGNWQRARARIEMRDLEVAEERSNELYKYMSPEEIAFIRQENEQKAIALLDRAIEERDYGSQDVAFDICDEIFWRRRNSKSTVADILAIIGTLDKISSKTDYYNEAAIWHYRQLQIQKVPGDWQPKIEKAEAALKKSQDISQGKLRAELGTQQALLDAAEMKKVNGESDEEIGRILMQLLGSGFVSIRAQYHMLFAELESTPDRLGHAREAASRLTYLQKKADGEGNWGGMQERVDNVRRAFQRGGRLLGMLQ